MNRMLTSPRYHTWLVVELVDTYDLLPSEQQPFVILLSAELDDAKVRKAAIERWLSPAGETTKWLSSLSPRTQKAIQMKAPFPGMHQDELIAAMGPPQMWIRARTARTADGRVVPARRSMGERYLGRQPSSAETKPASQTSRTVIARTRITRQEPSRKTLSMSHRVSTTTRVETCLSRVKPLS